MTGTPPSSSSSCRENARAFSASALRLRCALIGAFIVFFACLPDGNAAAQMFSYNPDRVRAVQSVSFGYTSVDFQFSGDGTPDPSFEFAGPIYGAVYSRPNFHVAFGYGAQDDEDLRMLDASLTTWGEFRVLGSALTRLYIPIALHSSYRRVAPEGEEDSLVDAFNITVLGLGTGLGFAAQTAGGVQIEGRATPIIGLALRAFGDSAGSSRLIDTHVQVHAPGLAGRFGVSAGYGFRAQVWSISASSLFPVTQDDLFDYAGSAHSLSVGINW